MIVPYFLKFFEMFEELLLGFFEFVGHINFVAPASGEDFIFSWYDCLILLYFLEMVRCCLMVYDTHGLN